MSEKHKRFQDLLRASEESVWDVMRWLSDSGYSVRKEPTLVAPTVEEKDAYKDNADFEVCLPVEVKALSASFTGRHDWPFGKHFIVDSAVTFDKKVRAPFRYIYLNVERTHCAILDVAKTRKYWYKQTRQCGNYADVGGLESEFYIVDRKYVSFFDLSKPARKESA